MESLRHDIRTNKTLNHLKPIEETIIETAKNIKSNDSLFNINTLGSTGPKLQKLMKRYDDVINRIQANQKAFTTVEKQIESFLRGQQNPDPDAPDDECQDIAQFEKKFEAECKKESNKQKNNQSSGLSNLESVIQLDEEIVMEEAPDNWPIDPITKAAVVEPVRSKICKHIYDNETIKQYIAQKQSRKKRSRCPVAGCENLDLRPDQLEPVTNLVR